MEMEVMLKSGKTVWIITDKSWKVGRTKEGEWKSAEELGMPPAGWGEIRKKK
jgi:hypothetical protein